MNVKLIAIGNKIMGDDRIGPLVAEHLEKFLSQLGIEVVIGETDIGYCLSKINEKDMIISPSKRTATPVKYTISLMIGGKTPIPTRIAKPNAGKLTNAPKRKKVNFRLIFPTDLLIKII